MAKNDNVVPDPEREGKFAFVCPIGFPHCGKEGESFVSAGWPTKAGAAERGAQHLAEHETGEPMPTLADSGIAGAVR